MYSKNKSLLLVPCITLFRSFLLLIESIVGVYENKITKQRVVYGEAKCDTTKDYSKYISLERYFGFKEITKDDYLEFAKEWKFIGRTLAIDVVNNFKNVINKLGDKTKVCFILGPTIHDELKEMNQSAADADKYYKELNELLVNEFKDKNNISFYLQIRCLGNIDLVCISIIIFNQCSIIKDMFICI